MIYVTCGMHTQGFDRLVRAMDELAATIDEDVVIQRGSAAYVPQHARFSDYFSRENADSLIRDARVVVAHAGIGTIMQALKHGTPLVLVPRRKKHREHNSDHQLEVAMEVHERYGIPVVDEVGDIPAFLEHPVPIRRSEEGRRAIIAAVRSFLQGS